MVKAVVQKSLSFLPDSQRWNRVFQDRVSGGTTMGQDFLDLHIEWAGQHLGVAERMGIQPDNFTALELGTGWFPVVPICLHLAGASQTYLCDLEDLSDLAMLSQAIDGVLSAADSGDLKRTLPRVDAQRLKDLRDLRSELENVGLAESRKRLGFVMAMGDVREFTPGVAPDLMCSNTVFEHIPREVLTGILGRFSDVAAPGAVMSNIVDLCDHYAYMDDSVGVYNFLRFSDRSWRWINNDIQPLNRLRAHEYLELYAEAGVEVTEEHLYEFDTSDLFGLPLADRFRDMTPDQVACKTTWLITKL